ncbi:MgtC/SapB family protein [Rubellimicrobium rubrum]|uniref:Protein MgtC n=1 Tax=Rubellimicrobium rubrum TaxID=2585369 RepID=A0A5C4MZW2_9RHOB|nr:MgtC/SapB family protein [Rubellimicrobium rubrum]TNC50073.1 MgtC/SapB family protein [Rubellimicrobium rubrum]
MRELIARELSDTFVAVPFPVALLRIVAAVILAGLIGAEREWRRKPAGLRTHMLVSLAACLYVVVGRELVAGDFVGAPDGQMRVDPLHLIEAVTAGVAFLVAGIVITSGGRVLNVTTGASLWLAGAIGLACGAGEIPLAALATVVVLVVLTALTAVAHLPGAGTDD